MEPQTFLQRVVDPSLLWLSAITGKSLNDDKARVLVLAIAGQESGWKERRQIGGPARSYWQFERGGGVAGVVSHLSTAKPVKLVCEALDIPADPFTIYDSMAWCDMLACSMARLLLWTDPAPLPEVGHVQAAWDYYLRNWRPGMPHPEFWPVRYGTALGLVRGPVIRDAPATIEPGKLACVKGPT